MYKYLHILTTGSAFMIFFVGSAVYSWIAIPLIQLLVRDPKRRTEKCARMMFRSNQWFFWYMRVVGLLQIRHGKVPDDMPAPGEPYVMLSNHPTLLDSVLLLGSFFRLTTIAKASFYNSWMVGRFLRATGNLCAPEPSPDTAFGATVVLDRMVEHLKDGYALLVFPEGTRSPPHQLNRFRRGACEAAIRAGVPIVPVFIHVDPPSLLKGQKWHSIPHRMLTYTVEYLPIIHTRGHNLDSRELNRELYAHYRQRCDALAPTSQPKTHM